VPQVTIGALPRLRRAKPHQPPQPPRPASCLSGPVYLSDTGVSSEKCLVSLSDTDASSEKCLVSLPDTPARPKKRRFWESSLSVPAYIRSILDSHHRIGPNIRRI